MHVCRNTPCIKRPQVRKGLALLSNILWPVGPFLRVLVWPKIPNMPTSASVYTVGSKNVTPNFCSSFLQILTDCNNSFAGTPCGQSATTWFLNISPHLVSLHSVASKGTPATQNASQKFQGDKNKEVKGDTSLGYPVPPVLIFQFLKSSWKSLLL